MRVILIGGSSHVGKSTLADSLALELGWKRVSTDKLGYPHPGRPWPTKSMSVPEHVAEHYLSLSVNELITDVLRHYRSMWPVIKEMIAAHATDLSTEQLILEGSALWPESVAALDFDNVAAIWLTAGADLFQERIANTSRFEESSGREKAMILKFLERTCLYNEQMMTAVNRLGLVSMDVEETSSLEELSDNCLRLLRKQP